MWKRTRIKGKKHAPTKLNKDRGGERNMQRAGDKTYVAKTKARASIRKSTDRARALREIKNAVTK